MPDAVDAELDFLLAIEDRRPGLDDLAVLLGLAARPVAGRHVDDGAVRQLLARPETQLAAVRRVGQAIAAGGVLHEHAVGQVVDQRPQQVALGRQRPGPLGHQALEVGAQLLEPDHGPEPDDVHEQRQNRRRHEREEEAAPRIERRVLARDQDPASQRDGQAGEQPARREQEKARPDHEQQQVRRVARLADQVQVDQAVGQDEGRDHHRVDLRALAGQASGVEQPVEDQEDHGRRSGEDHHRHRHAGRKHQRMGDREQAEEDGEARRGRAGGTRTPRGRGRARGGPMRASVRRSCAGARMSPVTRRFGPVYLCWRPFPSGTARRLP